MLNNAEMKKIVKAADKRTGKDFIEAFDAFMRRKLDECIKEHNAGKKTLDSAVVHLVCGSPR